MVSVRDYPSVAIVGGGISGLYSAWLLSRAYQGGETDDDGRTRIILFETSDRLGGRVETMDLSEPTGESEACACGHLIAEFGPMRFEEPVQNRFRALCETLEVQRRDFSSYHGERISYPRYQLVQSERYVTADVSEDLHSLELLKLGILRIVRDAIRTAPNTGAGRYPGPTLPSELITPKDVFRFTDRRYEVVPEWRTWFEGTDQRTWDFLRRSAKLEGIHLHEMGLWNALELVLTHQAVMKIRDVGTFYHLIPNNPNAAEWIVFWLRAFKHPSNEQLKQIVGGSGVLVTRLARQIERTVDIRMRHEVVGIARDPSSERVVLQVRDKTEPHDPVFDLTVDHAILALPAGAITQLCDNFPQRIRGHLESVIGFPLVKGFLVTKEPWWGRDQPPQAGAGNVPTRELHYFVETRRSTGTTLAGDDDRATGMVLLYTDHPADEFWRTFIKLSESHDRATVFLAKDRKVRALGWQEGEGNEPATDARVLADGAGAEGLDDNEHLVRTMVHYLIDDCRPFPKEFGRQIIDTFLPTMEGFPKERIEALRAANEEAEDDRRAGVFQYGLHYGERATLYQILCQEPRGTLRGNERAVAPSEILFPVEREQVEVCAIRDWSRPPFWAGCHVWKPGAKSWEAVEQLRSFGLLGAKEADNIHVCGEAYSDYQGFIEGALRSAEDVVREIVGTARFDRVNPPEVEPENRRFHDHGPKCTVVRQRTPGGAAS